jgi:hypothetical protein
VTTIGINDLYNLTIFVCVCNQNILVDFLSRLATASEDRGNGEIIVYIDDYCDECFPTVYFEFDLQKLIAVVPPIWTWRRANERHEGATSCSIFLLQWHK